MNINRKQLAKRRLDRDYAQFQIKRRSTCYKSHYIYTRGFWHTVLAVGATGRLRALREFPTMRGAQAFIDELSHPPARPARRCW